MWRLVRIFSSPHLFLEEQVAFPDMHHRWSPLGGVVTVTSALEAFPGRPFPLDFKTAFTNLLGSRRGNEAFFVMVWPVGMALGSVKDGTVVIAKDDGIHNRCSSSELFWLGRCDCHERPKPRSPQKNLGRVTRWTIRPDALAAQVVLGGCLGLSKRLFARAVPKGARKCSRRRKGFLRPFSRRLIAFHVRRGGIL